MDGHGRVMTGSRRLFGYPITYTLHSLDDGVHVLLTGGCRSHIGAVSVAEQGVMDTKVFPGHKDHFLSEPWALAISEKTGQRCCVVCGIHYDDATEEQIKAIVAAAGDLLAELLEKL